MHMFKIFNLALSIGDVNAFPTMHYFENPRHTQTIIAYMTLTEYFWRFQWGGFKEIPVGMLLTCPIEILNTMYNPNFITLACLSKVNNSFGWRKPLIPAYTDIPGYMHCYVLCNEVHGHTIPQKYMAVSMKGSSLAASLEPLCDTG